MALQSDPQLGILMLDTRFPRIPGDVGNPATWAFPVRYHIVPGATPEAIVENDPAPFVDRFISAGRALVAEGCTAIATTCGFLSLVRSDLSREIGVPVASSALEQSRQINDSLPPGQTLGILTISAASLTGAHLKAAGVPEDAPIGGLDGTGFAQSILGNKTTLDVAGAEQDMVAAALALVHRNPRIGALLLECTNMPPYASAVSRATGRPVYSIYTYLNWFHQSLAPDPFAR